jgi:hypothetical protein
MITQQGDAAMDVLEKKDRLVFSGSAASDESIKAAQALVIGKFSWHILAPAPYRMHCMMSFEPVPTVTCLVVDVRSVEDDDGMAEIIKTFTDPKAGVTDLEKLLSGLEKLGAKVQKAEGGKQTARELSEARMELKEKRTGRRVRVH